MLVDPQGQPIATEATGDRQARLLEMVAVATDTYDPFTAACSTLGLGLALMERNPEEATALLRGLIGTMGPEWEYTVHAVRRFVVTGEHPKVKPVRSKR